LRRLVREAAGKRSKGKASPPEAETD
jgi:hypothetical protein